MLLRKRRSQPVFSFETDPKAKDVKFPEPTETAHNPEESCISNALENECIRAIRYLPPTLRVVVQIRYRENASLAQIAKILDISEPAAKSRLLRARSKIREHLEKNNLCIVESPPMLLARVQRPSDLLKPVLHGRKVSHSLC